MSKKIFLVFGLMTIISFSSCRKNRTCNCVTTITTNGTVSSTQKDHIITDVNKDEGEIECAAFNDTTAYTNILETVGCTLNQ